MKSSGIKPFLWRPFHVLPLSSLGYVLFFFATFASPLRVRQLTVESTKLKAVEDVRLLPLAGSFFEGKDFPTGDAAKMVSNHGAAVPAAVSHDTLGLTLGACCPRAL